MIIVKYERRLTHVTHAPSAAVAGLFPCVKVPEMIAEWLSTDRLSACSRNASTAPVLDQPCSQRKLATNSLSPTPSTPTCKLRLSSPLIDTYVCFFPCMCAGLLLTFLSHLAFAFAQCTQAIGIRSGDSMPRQMAVEKGERALGEGAGRAGRRLAWLRSAGGKFWERAEAIRRLLKRLMAFHV